MVAKQANKQFDEWIEEEIRFWKFDDRFVFNYYSEAGHVFINKNIDNLY